MREINLTFTEKDNELYKKNLIRQGENNASILLCTIPEDMLGYQYILVFKINNETPIFTTEQFPVDGVITYDVTNILTSKSGDLKIELHAYENLSLVNEVLIKSALCKLKVAPALDAASEIVPEDYVPWYTQVVNMYDEVVDIEEHVDDVYENIVTDELARQEAEVIRVSSENARIGAEAIRNDAEIIRLAAEGLRNTAYETAEGVRDGQYSAAESGRDSAYNAQELVRDGLYDAAEGARDDLYDAAEALRESAESSRTTAETGRSNAESLRGVAERSRDNAENLRASKESERVQAENARNVYENYNANKGYVLGNKVIYQGSSYLNITPCIGMLPTNASYWRLIAQKGEAGAPGSSLNLKVNRQYDTYEDLPTNPDIGYMCLVGSDLYIFTETGWVNAGKLTEIDLDLFTNIDGGLFTDEYGIVIGESALEALQDHIIDANTHTNLIVDGLEV